MHCCLKALAFLQASRETLQKDALPSPKIEGKPGVSLLAAKIPLKTTFNPSIFALFDEKGCHHSKDFLNKNKSVTIFKGLDLRVGIMQSTQAMKLFLSKSLRNVSGNQGELEFDLLFNIVFLDTFSYIYTCFHFQERVALILFLKISHSGKQQVSVIYDWACL